MEKVWGEKGKAHTYTYLDLFYTHTHTGNSDQEKFLQVLGYPQTTNPHNHLLR